MRKHLLFIGLFIGALGLAAQEAPSSFPDKSEAQAYDLLYLRDGSVLAGRLKRYLPDRGLEFELRDGQVIAFPARKVKRVVQAGAGPPSGGGAKTPQPYAFQENGVYYAMYGAAIMGRDFRGFNAPALGSSLTVGYQHARLLGAGLGLGVDAYAPGRSEIIYPVFGEVRGYLAEKKLSPYYAVRAGYGLVFADPDRGVNRARGGLLFHPALGYRFGASPLVNFVADLGFQYQRVDYDVDAPWGAARWENRYRHYRVILRAGLVF
jgi:hypothetical protein